MRGVRGKPCTPSNHWIVGFLIFTMLIIEPMKTLKIALFFSLMSSFIFSANAETIDGVLADSNKIPVEVQCQIQGPVYSGDLQFETDFTQWKPARDCENHSGSGDSSRDYSVPSFRLEFNGVSYVSSSSETMSVSFFRTGCLPDTMRTGTLYFSAQESKSGRRVTVRLPCNGKWPEVCRSYPNGKIPVALEISDGLRNTCVIKALSN